MEDKKIDIDELNEKNKALTVLLNDCIDTILQADDKYKDYEVNRLSSALCYISSELMGNSTEIGNLINGDAK